MKHLESRETDSLLPSVGNEQTFRPKGSTEIAPAVLQEENASQNPSFQSKMGTVVLDVKLLASNYHFVQSW